jgi:MFS family permease
MLSVLSDRDYRLLWLGQTIALLGDQFHLIALPWLVLQLTRDPLQLGIVLAVAGVARTVSMLFGGALADRYSPRDIMIYANAVRGAMAAGLAAAVLTGAIEMWMVYAAALAFGVVTGIFEPASQAAVPRLVADEQLESGNSLVFLGDQLASFLGPTAAGVLIGWFATRAPSGEEVASLTGIGFAFVVHAATFAVSIGLLALIGRMTALGGDEHDRPLQAIAQGFRFVAARRHLVWILLLIALANLFMTGPLLVGVPVLADARLPEGAAALGLVLSGYAFGNLLGLVLAGTVKRPSPRVFGAIVVLLFAAFAAGLSVFAWVTSTWTAVPVIALMGIGNGYLGVAVVTHLQRSVRPEMIGRMMSLFMVAMFAVMPLSQALSGVVVKASVEALFLGAAAGMLLSGVLALSRPEVRRFGETTAGEGAGSEPAAASRSPRAAVSAAAAD